MEAEKAISTSLEQDRIPKTLLEEKKIGRDVQEKIQLSRLAEWVPKWRRWRATFQRLRENLRRHQMIAFWRKKFTVSSAKIQSERQSSRFEAGRSMGVKDISWQSCRELAILNLNENWYLQNKCSAKNQRISKIKRRSLLQIESVSWHHSHFHNWVSFV